MEPVESNIKPVIFLGCDPGKSGCFTIYDPQLHEFDFYFMPYHKVPSGKKLKSGKDEMKDEFHPAGFRDLILEIHKKYKDCKIMAAIEDNGGRQGWSAQNNWEFGHVTGLQELSLIMLKADIEFVRPAKWQNYMYKNYQKVMVPSSTGKSMVNDTKATSALVAQQIEPSINFAKTERSTTIPDGKTDSFLICLYRYYRHLEGK
jgi:hypothetical protein